MISPSEKEKERLATVSKDEVVRNVSNKSKVFVLTNDNQGWHEIDEKDLQNWADDDSIKDGDLIIFPRKVMVAEEMNIKRILIREELK